MAGVSKSSRDVYNVQSVKLAEATRVRLFLPGLGTGVSPEDEEAAFGSAASGKNGAASSSKGGMSAVSAQTRDDVRRANRRLAKMERLLGAKGSTGGGSALAKLDGRNCGGGGEPGSDIGCDAAMSVAIEIDEGVLDDSGEDADNEDEDALVAAAVAAAVCSELDPATGLPRSGGFFAPNGRWPSEISPGCGAVGANGAAMPAWRPGGGGGGGRPLSGAFTRAWAGQSHYSGGGSSRAGNFAAAEASRTTVWERLTQAGAAAQRAAAEKREAARVAAQTRSVLRPVQVKSMCLGLFEPTAVAGPVAVDLPDAKQPQSVRPPLCAAWPPVPAGRAGGGSAGAANSNTVGQLSPSGRAGGGCAASTSSNASGQLSPMRRPARLSTIDIEQASPTAAPRSARSMRERCGAQPLAAQNGATSRGGALVSGSGGGGGGMSPRRALEFGRPSNAAVLAAAGLPPFFEDPGDSDGYSHSYATAAGGSGGGGNLSGGEAGGGSGYASAPPAPTDSLNPHAFLHGGGAGDGRLMSSYASRLASSGAAGSGAALVPTASPALGGFGSRTFERLSGGAVGGSTYTAALYGAGGSARRSLGRLASNRHLRSPRRSTVDGLVSS